MGHRAEDYSPDGTAWDYFPHDHARSRAYRWGEDGIGGMCDRQQLICFALTLWNGKDPILKERFFGLTGNEGNHGEDVKEYYFYLDSTPTHSYMKFLYKYPQLEYPYQHLKEENQRRGKHDWEYELLDTGIFQHNRYFDVEIEYAKATHEDILIQITAHNRGPDVAELHLLPTIWFRNTWSWSPGASRPSLEAGENGAEFRLLRLATNLWADAFSTCPAMRRCFSPRMRPTTRAYSAAPTPARTVKDGINDAVVHDDDASVNSDRRGTKACSTSSSPSNPGKAMSSVCA